MDICAGLGEIWMRFIRIGAAHLNKIITNSPYVKGPDNPGETGWPLIERTSMEWVRRA
jgi:hypothetical protein